MVSAADTATASSSISPYRRSRRRRRTADRVRVLLRRLPNGNLYARAPPLGHRGASALGRHYSTILRDNIYADFTPHFLGTDGNIRGPAGDGRSLVAMADVAEVAIAVLTSDGAYDGQTLNLTGPAALTMREIASALSDHLGRAVSYIPEMIDEAYASRASYGAPEWQVEGWVNTYLAIAVASCRARRHF